VKDPFWEMVPLVQRGEMMSDEIVIDTRTTNEDITNHAAEQLLAEVAIWKEKYLRLCADLENTKKRLERTSSREVEAQKENLLKDILPIADGLDLALKHISPEDDSRNIVQGIEMNQTILNKFFSKYNVEAMDVLGQKFDPNLHESLGMVRYPGVAPDTVIRVEQKGYLHRGKLLRPAQVLIAAP